MLIGEKGSNKSMQDFFGCRVSPKPEQAYKQKMELPVVHNLKGHTDSVLTVAFGSGERYAISGSKDRTVRVWDLLTGKCVKILEGHTNVISGVAMSSDGHRAFSSSMDNTVRVWNLETGKCVAILKGAQWRGMGSGNK